MLWFIDGLTHHAMEPGPEVHRPGADADAAAAASGSAQGAQGTAAERAPAPVSSPVSP